MPMPPWRRSSGSPVPLSSKYISNPLIAIDGTPAPFATKGGWHFPGKVPATFFAFRSSFARRVLRKDVPPVGANPHASVEQKQRLFAAAILEVISNPLIAIDGRPAPLATKGGWHFPGKVPGTFFAVLASATVGCY